MHKSRAVAFLAFLAWFALAAGARADTTVRVLASHPAEAVVTLGMGQTCYVRIGYSTDEPVRIWARPYFQGAEVDAGSNPSPAYTGSGEALGWFFFMEPGKRVDEIRINAGTASGTRVVATHPVHIVSSGGPAATMAEPAWVADLKRESERLQREADEKRMSAPPSAGETLFFGGFMLAVVALGIAGVAAPAWAMRRWRGGWRVAAAVPAVMIGFVVLRLLVGTALDPTSHNLWPFEILQVGFLSLVVIGVLLTARKLSGAE